MRSGTGRGTHGDVRDGSGDPQGGSGWVGLPLGRFGTGWGTLGEVRVGSGYPLGGLGRIVGTTGRSMKG